MVKGISRQVIVVQGCEPALFEQAIFILTEKAVNQGVTDEQLMKEAKRLIRTPSRTRVGLWRFGAFWAALGAGVTSLIWLIGACVL